MTARPLPRRRRRVAARATAVIVASLVLLPRPGVAEEAGLPVGLWEVRIFTPVPTPELKQDEQVFRVCYDAKAAKRHSNPVLPGPQLATCQVDFTDMGDVAYDAACPEGDYRLRINAAAEGLWRGTLRFLAREPRLMLEPAVELKRLSETCP